MTEPVFFFRDGSLWHRSVWWDREQMERMAEHLASPRALCPELAPQCRQALADYDDFYAENEDEQLRYETETAA